MLHFVKENYFQDYILIIYFLSHAVADNVYQFIYYKYILRE